jgi:hypothetical protein
MGIAPSEFWRMNPRHFWWLVEANNPPKRKSRLTKADAKSLRRMLEKANDTRP